MEGGPRRNLYDRGSCRLLATEFIHVGFLPYRVSGAEAIKGLIMITPAWTWSFGPPRCTGRHRHGHSPLSQARASGGKIGRMGGVTLEAFFPHIFQGNLHSYSAPPGNEGFVKSQPTSPKNSGFNF